MTTLNTRHVYPISYSGNIFWLILFAIFWPPLGVFLFVKNGRFIKNNSAFYLQYRGSWFWVIFWALLFFPVAILLMALRGADVIEENISAQHQR